MKSSIKIFLLLAIISTFLACGVGTSKVTETPTSGNIKIGVDESYQLMIQSQIELFEAIYQYAIINPKYGPEADILEQLLNDSVRIAIVNRRLTKEENDFLLSKQIYADTTKIAYDALAFIVNKENPDSNLRFDQIKDIFSGKIKTWQEIDLKSKLKNLDVIFDNNRSGNPRYIRERFKIDGKFPENCFAVKSNEEVIKYVQDNPHALGIISVNWISDKDDTTSNKFMKAIKVVGISNEFDTEGVGPFLKPYQGYIAEGSYPFIRDVWVISRETFSGLGTGFASFLAGEKGQRVILKTGLVPATMPIRLVQVKQ
jgi:phosphate transport system substrate-binding protein